MEKVEELMTTNHLCCSIGSTLQEVSKRIEKDICSEIIIIDNENDKHPIGIISEHDVTSEVAKGINPLEVSARDCMRKIPITINSKMSLEDCLKALEHKKIKKAPVVDGEGRYCGQIDVNDIRPFFNE